MSDLTQEDLVRIAHQFYPRGFPPEDDDLSEPTPAHQRTPEHQRFMAAWERALHWEKWGAFMDELRTRFPEHAIGGGTQPFVSACLRCQLYKAQPAADGDQLVTRVAVAVSVLAPLYVVYATTQQVSPHRDTERPNAASASGPFFIRRASRQQLTFEPEPGIQPQAVALGQLVERVLECRPFPLQLAHVPLQGIRIGQLNYLSSDPPPTLLDALFSDDLANLP